MVPIKLDLLWIYHNSKIIRLLHININVIVNNVRFWPAKACLLEASVTVISAEVKSTIGRRVYQNQTKLLEALPTEYLYLIFALNALTSLSGVIWRQMEYSKHSQLAVTREIDTKERTTRTLISIERPAKKRKEDHSWSTDMWTNSKRG